MSSMNFYGKNKDSIDNSNNSKKNYDFCDSSRSILKSKNKDSIKNGMKSSQILQFINENSTQNQSSRVKSSND